MTLYVAATPLGNADDVSLRLLATLRDLQYIFCEDSRRIRKLCMKHEIDTKGKSFLVYSDMTERKSLQKCLDILSSSDAVLVSDAGTPLISDPGYLLVRACHEHGVAVVSLPGPSALVAALSIAGVSTDRFTFYGFLAKKGKARSEVLDLIAARAETAVVYESPNRICRLLASFATLFPDRDIVVCRELTKKFETVYRGKATDVLAALGDDPKGEFVVVVGK